jgi:hypothetical protein
VEANTGTAAVDSRRQPAPVAPLFAVSGAAAEGAHGGAGDAGVSVGGDASRAVSCGELLLI